jgi:hypothetical protein
MVQAPGSAHGGEPMARLRRSSETGSGPSGSHHFVDADNVRLGLALLSSQPNYGMVSQATVANASVRASRCSMSGCGKPRKDPIHWLSGPEADRNFGEFPADSEDDWQVGVGLVETEDDVAVQPMRSDGIAVVPHHPSNKG